MLRFIQTPQVNPQIESGLNWSDLQQVWTPWPKSAMRNAALAISNRQGWRTVRRTSAPPTTLVDFDPQLADRATPRFELLAHYRAHLLGRRSGALERLVVA